MTAPERFEQDLPRLLAQLAPGTRPDYRDSLVETVERTSQRPAWTFPGRWLPVDITMQRVGPASAFRVPITLLLVAALLGVALFAIAVASRPDLPAPFGPAQNGRIVYASAGDLYIIESDGAKPQLLLGGPERDRDPDFSRQGDRLTFLREGSTGTAVYTIRPDGSDLKLVAGPLVGLDWPAWSADGSRIAFTQRPGGMPIVSVADTATGAIRDLDLAGQADQPLLWRPGHPDELLYRGMTDAGAYRLGLVNVATGFVRPLDIPSEPGAPFPLDFQLANWSPDGRRLVVEVGNSVSTPGVAPSAFLKIVDIADDGTVTGIHPFIHDPAADYEYFGSFTPDGTSVLFASQAGCVFQAWLAPVDDPTAAVAVGEPLDHPSGCAKLSNGPWFGIIPWMSPDGTRMFNITREGSTEDRVVVAGTDGTGGVPLEMTTSGAVTWQRVAP
jgi:WD40-like Beta Propeller Repeat